MTIEIVAITTESLTKTVAIVQHRRHTVETEAVKLELLEPVLTVTEQEVQNVVLAIVEAQRVPCRMLMTVASIEELVGITAKVTQTLYLILHSVAVYNIHNHGNTHLVSRINHFLQVLRRTETAGGSKE